MMTTAISGTLSEVELWRDNTRTTHRIVRRNVEGISHEESLAQPQPQGNCLNWVLGHLVCAYDETLSLLKQKPVLGREALKRYARGTPPLQDGAEATDLAELLNAWDQSSQRVEAGLASLTAEELDAKAPASPRNDPNETVRSLLGLCFTRHTTLVSLDSCAAWLVSPAQLPDIKPFGQILRRGD
jgi:uncharacterized damage-inducible protein DinB